MITIFDALALTASAKFCIEDVIGLPVRLVSCTLEKRGKFDLKQPCLECSFEKA